jgi:hypothetical protein
MENIFDRITIPGGGYTPTAAVPQAGDGAAPFVGSTGLVASIEAVEFERIVKDAIDPVILCTTSTAATAANGRPAALRSTRRYVMCCGGIVFIAQSVRPLQFAPEVRLVECHGIVYDGRSLC